MSVTIAMLAQIPVFGQLQGTMLQQIANQASVIKCKRNEILYNQDATLIGLYAIIDGYVKLYRQSGQRTQILALLRRGDSFGAEALSDKANSSYYAATLTPVTLIFLPADSMLELMQSYPDIRVILLQMVTKRLRQFASLVHNLAFRDVTARLSALIIARAEQDGMITDEGIHVPRLMTQSDLATMIGTAREVVQRTLKKLEQENIVHVSRKEFLILNIDRLRQIAEEETR
ncbi:MAG: Crp/Fnr family transcriptional regulator [Anaerolineae bacterium]|nr:Crp/Fnr family transcriptional regulator [Anaerolineae bacterium]